MTRNLSNDESMPEPVDTKLLITFNQTLDKLGEQELRILYRKVAEKLKLFDKMKQLKSMSQFSGGDQVTFQHHDERIIGKIIRLNRKTVTVHTIDHHDWTVSPTLLSKVITPD